MSLLFPFHNVSVEEIEEVRLLLEENKIPFYETDSGIFGTAIAGIWLKDESQLSLAKDLLRDYSAQRSERMQEFFKQEKLAGNNETLWQRFKSRPFWFVTAMFFLLVILYISTVPFINLKL